MHPVRILVLLVLFYLLFRLLIGAGKRNKNGMSGTPQGRKVTEPDILREDPICHVLVPTRSAITLKKDGKILYFCSENCRDQFNTIQAGERK